jgi:hypothetical protein
MVIRFTAASLAVLLLAACDDPSSKKASEDSVCRGLSETDCTSKAECLWNAKKTKCKKRDREDTKPESTSSEIQ